MDQFHHTWGPWVVVASLDIKPPRRVKKVTVSHFKKKLTKGLNGLNNDTVPMS